MKNLLIILAVVSWQTVSLAQTNAQSQVGAQPQEAAITQRQIADLPLPRRGFRPKITLQRALKMAERYLAKEKIDLSPYYLYQAKYTLYGSKENQEPCWFFWWMNESGAAGDYVEIIVSIETGKVTRLASM